MEWAPGERPAHVFVSKVSPAAALRTDFRGESRSKGVGQERKGGSTASGTRTGCHPTVCSPHL